VGGRAALSGCEWEAASTGCLLAGTRLWLHTVASGVHRSVLVFSLSGGWRG